MRKGDGLNGREGERRGEKNSEERGEKGRGCTVMFPSKF